MTNPPRIAPLDAQLAVVPQPEHVHGSSAIYDSKMGDLLCWLVNAGDCGLQMVLRVHALMSEKAPIFWLPFWVFSVPVRRWFIAEYHAGYYGYTDDVDYSPRWAEWSWEQLTSMLCSLKESFLGCLEVVQGSSWEVP